MVLPADCHGGQSALDSIGVERNAGFVEEALEPLPELQRMADRLAEHRAREDRLRREPGLPLRVPPASPLPLPARSPRSRPTTRARSGSRPDPTLVGRANAETVPPGRRSSR